MDTLSYKPNIFLLVTIFIMAVGVLLFSGLINEKPLLFLNLFAQELSDSVINSSNISSLKSDTTGNICMEQNDSKTVVASGHFANNQMKDGVVTWIQGGFWNLGIDNS